LILPGSARIMGDGWENARRRDDGNDYVEFQLAAPGIVRLAELDTSYFVGNAPGWVSLSGRDARSDKPTQWRVLLAKTPVQPDTPHRFPLTDEYEVTHVRLDVYPDGGLARVRLHGRLGDHVRDELTLRWFNALPARHAVESLVAAGVQHADALVAARPLAEVDLLPRELRS
jgi:allantoicase